MGSGAMRPLVRMAALLGLLDLCAVVVPASAATAYNIVEIGPFPTDVFGQPAALNDFGQVVGTANGPSGSRAFYWSSATGVQDVGILPGDQYGIGSGINGSGQVVGYSATNFGGTHAFSWKSGAGLQGPGGANGAAYGVNDAGVIVGSAQLGPAYGPAVAWVNGQIHDLGALSDTGNPDNSAAAYAINKSGQIVGTVVTQFGNGYPNNFGFLATLNGVHFLTGRPGSGGSSAVAINDSGQIVGSDAAPGAPGHALLWNSSGPLVDLGVLPGDVASSAAELNNAGQVVGLSFGGAGAHPFLWIPGGKGMLDLNSLIDPGQGWTLLSATDINNVGQIIGLGTHNGQQQAFLLNPVTPVPLPPALPLMAGALAALGLVRRKKAA